MGLTRRTFLGRASVGMGGALLASQLGSLRSSYAAHETVRTAVMGCGRGAGVAGWFARVPQSEIAIVCDVDDARAAKLCDRLEKETGKRPEQIADFRRALERHDIDALIVATPDHWHAPATIAACVAGKDVYVEKPASHNIREGRLAVKAAQKYQRVVQHGTQLRAVPHYEEAWQLLRDGIIGKVLMVKAINNQRRRRMPHAADEPVPAGVHYDLWIGPAPKRPFNRNRFHRGWHWLWDYGTGDLGNDGVHQVDLGRWALGLGAPKAVSCSGAKLGSRGDAQETPDTMVVTWEYDELLYVFEQRDFTPYRMQGHRLDNDNIIYGDEGYLMVDRDGYRVFRGNELVRSGGKVWRDTTRHYENFINCVRNRKTTELIADIEEGHLSSLLCHLGNISYRTGRRLRFDPKTETFPDDPDANRYLDREYRSGYELASV